MRRTWLPATVILAVALAFMTIVSVGQTRKLASVQAELTGIKGALTSATVQVGYRDPTYSELIQFLKEDESNIKEYNAESYTCRDFVAALNLATESQGIRAAFVSIRFRDGSHAVSGFNTVDRGMIYIEPQLNRPVTLDVGRSYSQANGFKLALTTQDDIIEHVTVIW